MSFQQSASYIAAVPDGTSLGGSSQIDLPVVSMEVRAVPDVPDGGTVQEDYDNNAWFETPTFHLEIMLEWGFERTDYAPTFQDTLRDLVDVYMQGNGPADFYVKYIGSTTTYSDTAYDTGPDGNDYVCPDMIPNIEQDNAGLVFSEQAREKERSIKLRSKSSNLTWNQVKFTFD